MGCLAWVYNFFHPGKKTVWFAWFIHFAVYVVFLITAAKAFHESSIAVDVDPFTLIFFCFPTILVGFFLLHSLYLLMGMVDAWTSYWHSGVATCSSFVLPFLYLVYALYVGRICWPPAGSVWATLPPELCKEEMRVSVGFAFAGVGTLGFFGFVFLLFVRKQDGETRKGGGGSPGVSRSHAMGSLIKEGGSLRESVTSAQLPARQQRQNNELRDNNDLVVNQDETIQTRVTTSSTLPEPPPPEEPYMRV